MFLKVHGEIKDKETEEIKTVPVIVNADSICTVDLSDRGYGCDIGISGYGLGGSVLTVTESFEEVQKMLTYLNFVVEYDKEYGAPRVLGHESKEDSSE